MMRHRLILYLTLISAVTAMAQTPHIETGRKLVLPERLTAILAHEFPAHRLPEIGDYRNEHPCASDSLFIISKGGDPHVNSLWYSLPDTALPYVCWGDFNGDDHTDAAFLLVPRQKEDSSLFVIVHLSPTGYETFEPWRRMPPDISSYYLQPLPPGVIQPYPMTGEEIPVAHATDALELINWEGWGYAFYWKDNAYHSVWTKD